MMRLTECFSINSDISKRIKVSGVSNNSCDNSFTNSVFPTPVGPTKINEAGRLLGLICTRLRRIAAETAFTASSCPIILLFSLSSIEASFFNSFSLTLEAGIPVQSSITLAISSSVTCAPKASGASSCTLFSRRASSQRTSANFS